MATSMRAVSEEDYHLLEIVKKNDGRFERAIERKGVKVEKPVLKVGDAIRKKERIDSILAQTGSTREKDLWQVWDLLEALNDSRAFSWNVDVTFTYSNVTSHCRAN